MTVFLLLALAAPLPPGPADGLIWLHDTKADRLLAFRVDGKPARTLDLPKGVPFLGLTPDGKILYAAASGGRMTYHVRALSADTAGTDLGVDHGPFDRAPIWTRDGRRFIRVRGEDPKRVVGVRSSVIEYAIFDLAAKRLTPLDLPSDRWVIGWTPDEKGFITMSVGDEDNGALFVVRDGKGPTPLKLGDPPIRPHRLAGARDGRTMLVPGYAPSPAAPWHQALWVADGDSGRTTEVIHEAGHGYSDACWSPDGKRLCLLWNYADNLAAGKGWDGCRMTVAKADGTGRVTVTLRDKAKRQDPYGLRLLGWFPAPR
jgi:dipeptidyl aminopeptidase/acylaminoacyl peptidase